MFDGKNATCWNFCLVFEKGWERQVSDLQISGRPVYAFRLGCKSGEELKYCLLDSVALIVGEGTVVGYVLGSEGSWERNEPINHALVHLHVVRRKKGLT